LNNVISLLVSEIYDKTHAVSHTVCKINQGAVAFLNSMISLLVFEICDKTHTVSQTVGHCDFMLISPTRKNICLGQLLLSIGMNDDTLLFPCLFII